MICGDISKVEYDLFQGQGGGSIPTSPLQCFIKPCKFEHISWVFRDFHYKKDHMGGGIDFCIAMQFGASVVGGVVIGKLRQDKAYSKTGNKCVEIRRMALIDAMPKNSESWLLGKTIWFLKKYTDYTNIISYSDKSVGHVGTIYKASNFNMIGETAPSKHVFWGGKRYHPRSLTIDRDYSIRLRKAILDGSATIETGLPKLIFEYVIKRKQ